MVEITGTVNWTSIWWDGVNNNFIYVRSRIIQESSATWMQGYSSTNIGFDDTYLLWSAAWPTGFWDGTNWSGTFVGPWRKPEIYITVRYVKVQP